MKSLLKSVGTAHRFYLLLLKIRPFTGRYFFLLLCIGGLLWYAVFTRSIIDQIERDAIIVTQSHAELVRTALSERLNEQEMDVIFREVIEKLNFPIIVTDTTWEPVIWRNVAGGSSMSSVRIAEDDNTIWNKDEVRKKVKEYQRHYEPKPIYTSSSGAKIGYLVYGNSDLIRSLSWMPFLEVGLIVAFVVFAFLGFHNIRVTERSNLWVALAKETAHQLGTPISSLLGWVEYMSSTSTMEEEVTPEEFVKQVHGICGNMDKDLSRLKKVTARFSQIGSVPALAPCDINAVLEDALEYFKLRLPLLGKRIEIRKSLSDVPKVPANHDLLEWVLENLLKNSLDAINKPDGVIEIKTEYVKSEDVVRVYHRDNGKGISWEDQKKIFSPGYTTKKRGWGLGLTLAKRIVEDYHNGQIYVSWSQKDKGTIFCLDLPAGERAKLQQRS